MRRIFLLILTLIIFSLSGCSLLSTETIPGFDLRSWEIVKKSAKDTTVTIVSTKDLENFKSSIESNVNLFTQENYGIKVNYINMDFSQIEKALKSDFDNETTIFSGDLLVLSKEETESLEKQGLLYDNFSSKIKSSFLNLDRSKLYINDYSVPFYKNSPVMYFNNYLVEDEPENFTDLKTYIDENDENIAVFSEHKNDIVQYAFLNSYAYNVTMNTNVTFDDFKQAVDQNIEEIFSIYKRFDFYVDIDDMYSDLYSESHSFFVLDEYYKVDQLIDEELMTPDAKASSTYQYFPGDITFLTIPFNSPNKSGSMVIIDYFLSIDFQKNMMDNSQLGAIPSVDYNVLTDESKAIIDKLSSKRTITKTKVIMNNWTYELDDQWVEYLVTKLDDYKGK
jgi:putative spermidine/putrescine transport system substrate-binding protein